MYPPHKEGRSEETKRTDAKKEGEELSYSNTEDLEIIEPPGTVLPYLHSLEKAAEPNHGTVTNVRDAGKGKQRQH